MLFLKVWMEVLSGGVRSNDNVYVHFIGILLRANANWNKRVLGIEKRTT